MRRMSPDRRASTDDIVLTFLRSLPETRLHRDVIEPLLRRLGTHVQYVHGQSEDGKDFVYTTRDAYGDSLLEVCQVKNTPFSARADSLNAIQLLTQLTQCRELEVTNPQSNLNERPNVVSLWTTYAIPVKATKGARLLLEELRANRCKIIGPAKLVELIKTYLPDMYSALG